MSEEPEMEVEEEEEGLRSPGLMQTRIIGGGVVSVLLMCNAPMVCLNLNHSLTISCIPFHRPIALASPMLSPFKTQLDISAEVH